MRKLWILAILIIFVLAGCGAIPGGIDGAVSTYEETTITAETTTAVTTTATQKPATAATTTTKKPIQKVQVESTTTVKTEATTKVVYPKTANLGKIINIGNGTVEFKSVEIDYENRLLIISVETSKGNSYKYSSKDKNGFELETAYNATTIWVSKASAMDNYSTISITCSVNKDNAEPVTTNIEIPII